MSLNQNNIINDLKEKELKINYGKKFKEILNELKGLPGVYEIGMVSSNKSVKNFLKINNTFFPEPTEFNEDNYEVLFDRLEELSDKQKKIFLQEDSIEEKAKKILIFLNKIRSNVYGNITQEICLSVERILKDEIPKFDITNLDDAKKMFFNALEKAKAKLEENGNIEFFSEKGGNYLLIKEEFDEKIKDLNFEEILFIYFSIKKIKTNLGEQKYLVPNEKLTQLENGKCFYSK